MNEIANLPERGREYIINARKIVPDTDSVYVAIEFLEQVVEELERQQREIQFYADDIDRLMDEIDYLKGHL